VPGHGPGAAPHADALNRRTQPAPSENPTLDAILILTTLAFFAISIAYAMACDRL
jgi:hypothetical protein